MQKGIRNIGVLAHVDGGKTTITENLLHLCGAIKTIGSVDKGSSVTDSLDIEKERGISIKAASTSFEYKNTTINLIDTPGHIDFSAEVERTLRVMDGAILVISAAEGIQSHTYSLFEAIKELKIPTLIFINKTDRPQSDYLELLKELKKELNIQAFPMVEIISEAENHANIEFIWNSYNSHSLKEAAIETLCENDEDLLEKYLDGVDFTNEELFNHLKQLTHQCILHPIYAGVAKNGIGIQELLEGIIEFLPSPIIHESELESALVFKIEHDKSFGRLAHIRLFNGKICVRDSIRNITRNYDGKISQIKKIYGAKSKDLKELDNGDIGIVCGLPEVLPGDILGSSEFIPELKVIQVSVLTVQVQAEKDEDYARLAESLRILSSEDPALEFKWYKEEKELHLKLMGAIQEQILKSVLLSRFNIEANFSKPTVIYKETPIESGEGFVRYWMPKPCWAIMKFKIEAGERGSGITYSSNLGVNDIRQKYQNEIERTIPKALEQGIKGWEVTDIKITLIEGEDHEIHSRPGDFILATPMGIMNGLQNSGTKLLEPLFKFEIKAPEDTLGQIASQLTNRRADFGNPEFKNEQFKMKGQIPVSTALDLSIRIHSITGGKGKLKLNFSTYQDCPNGEGSEREYKGVNPLNESQWILHQRGAFKADERNL